MRLIDADKAIECLKDIYSHEKDVINSFWLLNTLIDKVDELPTAYDINKVLSQLEESKCRISLTEDEMEIYRSAIDDSIEIVKADRLEELKAYRDKIVSADMTQTMLREQYNIAIDDFISECKANYIMEAFGFRMCDLEKIADELKKVAKSDSE